MNLRARLAAANRVQRSRPFKIIASILIVLAAVAVFTTYVVLQTAPVGLDDTARASEQLTVSPDEELAPDQVRARETVRSALQASERAVDMVLQQQSDWQSVGFGVLVVSALALTVAEWANRPRVRIDLESHGRPDDGEIDVSRTVGWFTTLFPIRYPVHI